MFFCFLRVACKSKIIDFHNSEDIGCGLYHEVDLKVDTNIWSNMLSQS
jgi:hypothetical protein